METIFYFSGRAGDLPAALLRHATEQLKEQNQKVAKMFDVGYLKRLVYVSQNMSSPYHRTAKATLRSLMRPKI